MKLNLTQEDQAIVDQAAEILRRQMVHPETRITCPDDACDYLKFKLADEQQQVFGMVFLNSRYRVIGDSVLFRGSVTHCSVYAREVVKEALKASAVKVIFYSNDPEGNECKVSEQSIRKTKSLKDALNLVDIKLVDCLLISGTRSLSYARCGHL